MSRTILRTRTSTVPDGIPPQLRQWIVTQNADNVRDNQDLEDEFNKIGAVKRWTPALTFATPGDLAVTYSMHMGDIIRTKDEIHATFNLVTSAFTWTTASGALRITGLPYTASTLADDSGFAWVGGLFFQGITKANYTQFCPAVLAADNIITITASGSGQAVSSVVAADVPSGGSVLLKGSVHFRLRS